ncbi:trypsin-like peptidase domain-containing protein [Candidatus Acetothermia bacterium]|nr:trypsin-like peptidase domain-containing protein [Candidatus Acetothermia bacterium]
MTVADITTEESPSRFADDFADVAEQLRRSTVQVRSRGLGSGSGVIWHSDGLIVTNAHVVHGPHATVELSDGRTFKAEIVARDPYRDLAMLRVTVGDLPAAIAGDSDALRVGELVLAMGNPMGLVGALTTGIIHAIGPTDMLGHQRWITADVRLAPGNSGGPLADAQGRVIGINTMISGGLALAVPSKAVERFLKSQGRHPYLGILAEPTTLPLENKHILGLVVFEVEMGSPAEETGLMIGDVLIGASGQFFNEPNDLRSALYNSEPSYKLRLDVLRGGKRITCDIVLRIREDWVEAT